MILVSMSTQGWALTMDDIVGLSRDHRTLEDEKELKPSTGATKGPVKIDSIANQLIRLYHVISYIRKIRNCKPIDQTYDPNSEYIPNIYA